MLNSIIKPIGRMIILAAIELFIYGHLFMWLWNAAMPVIFNLAILNFGQAALIFILGRLVVKPKLSHVPLGLYQNIKHYYYKNNKHLPLHLDTFQSIYIRELSTRIGEPADVVLEDVIANGIDYIRLLNNANDETKVKQHLKRIEEFNNTPYLKKMAEKMDEIILENSL